MPNTLIYCSLIFCYLLVSCSDKDHTKSTIPEPIEENARLRWINQMHKTAEDVDWRQIEYQNKLDHLQWRKTSAYQRNASSEYFAEDRIKATWRERGSINQAGRVGATTYFDQTQEIYLLSHGGSLWKGSIHGEEWTVVNDNYQFAFKSLIKLEVEGHTRLISIINKIPHFSDDLGLNWTATSGLNTYDNNWGFRGELRSSLDGSLIVLKVQEWLPGPWRSTIGIYGSTDAGETFTKIHDFGDISFDHVTISTPGNDQNILVLEIDAKRNQQHVYLLAEDAREMKELTTAEVLNFNQGPVPFYSIKSDGNTIIYTYDEDLNFLQSSDYGLTWDKIGVLPVAPWIWAGNLFISPSDPDFMLLGAQDCYRSTDGGRNWSLVNSWYEYYANIENKLHADMMYFSEFQQKDGTTFHLISNDGGLSISYDQVKTTNNLALNNLNVSQYYDCKTDQLATQYIYAASQDQGLQRSTSDQLDGILAFDQVSGGDFGHLTFSHQHQKLWAVYPGGTVYHYPDPQISEQHFRWELDSEDESVWLPPLANHPDGQKILMAGGNPTGGTGAFLIELSTASDNIIAEQLPFDFKKESGGQISAIAISPLDANLWYVATSNGLFYFSKDGGVNWDVSAQVGPAPQYLYGNVILPSKLDENVVFFAGSGYSTAPVYRSEDGGQTFQQMMTGLPPTLVLDMTSNQDESLLFAACESGPYVYFADENNWYPLLGQSAPMQAWWSVEYLPEDDIARFATYGRGIWDLEIEQIEGTHHDLIVENMQLSKDTVIDLEAFEISCEQHFQGKGNHIWTGSTAFYLSRDSLYSFPEDLHLLSISTVLTERQQTNTTVSITLPDTISTGSYYILAKIENDESIVEKDTNNNLEWSAFTYIIEEETHDFYLENVIPESDSLYIGEDLLVSFDQHFKGLGLHKLLVSTGFYLSSDSLYSVDDCHLFTSVKFLEEQQIRNESVQLNLPDTLSEGDQYLIVVIDDGNLYQELNESNNIKWSPFTVLASPTAVVDVSDIPLMIYPNPAIDFINLSENWIHFKQVYWYDEQGRSLKEGVVVEPRLKIPDHASEMVILVLKDRKEQYLTRKILLIN